jgi:PilZ domain-containing protein
MPATSPSQNAIDEIWPSVSIIVQLPESMSPGFFAKQGPMPVHHDDNKRGFHRHYMRGKAILKRGETTLGTYTKDISRKGIGLLSPVQLMPLERVDLLLPNGTQLHLEVARCRRVEKNCYDCGARFAL